MKFPEIGDVVTTETVLALCRHFNMDYLADRIEKNRMTTKTGNSTAAPVSRTRSWASLPVVTGKTSPIDAACPMTSAMLTVKRETTLRERAWI